MVFMGMKSYVENQRCDILKTILCGKKLFPVHFLELVTEVFRASWYMHHYGHFSPKPHMCLSNSRWVVKFSMGPLRGWKASMNSKKTTHVYKNAAGQKKWHGSKFLKKTQLLV